MWWTHEGPNDESQPTILQLPGGPGLALQPLRHEQVWLATLVAWPPRIGRTPVGNHPDKAENEAGTLQSEGNMAVRPSPQFPRSDAGTSGPTGTSSCCTCLRRRP